MPGDTCPALINKAMMINSDTRSCGFETFGYMSQKRGKRKTPAAGIMHRAIESSGNFHSEDPLGRAEPGRCAWDALGRGGAVRNALGLLRPGNKHRTGQQPSSLPTGHPKL